MGLTIHYSFTSTTRSAKRARQQVEQMRQLAIDLPFEEVGEIIELDHPDCDKIENKELRWLLFGSYQSVSDPKNKHRSFDVQPTKVFAVSIWPGPGCEELNLGLCTYPTELQKDYSRQIREPIKTMLRGYQWGSFCKTQYASNPECGGIPHFLRCHISSITLLERIAELPGIIVKIEDEGKYGPSTYSEDWREARDNGREPTYVWHPGKYNVKALMEEIGDWNQMIAAFSGAIKDSLGKTGMSLKSEISSFANFEELEFRGSQDANLEPFLQAMRQVSNKVQK